MLNGTSFPKVAQKSPQATCSFQHVPFNKLPQCCRRQHVSFNMFPSTCSFQHVACGDFWATFGKHVERNMLNGTCSSSVCLCCSRQHVEATCFRRIKKLNLWQHVAGEFMLMSLCSMEGRSKMPMSNATWARDWHGLRVGPCQSHRYIDWFFYCTELWWVNDSSKKPRSTNL